MTKDLTPVPYPNGDECLLAKVNALRELQSASGEELGPFFRGTLTPSVPAEAFKRLLEGENGLKRKQLMKVRRG